MTNCKFCKGELKGKYCKVFCSHSCSAKFNNKFNGTKVICKNCKISFIGKKRKFCSRVCFFDFKIKSSNKDIVLNKPVGIRPLKRYITELKGKSCSICKRKTWLKKPIGLILDHIDGNPYNNKVDNLRLICSNCDMQLPTYKAKNKGSGRYSRHLRYKKEQIELASVA